MTLGLYLARRGFAISASVVALAASLLTGSAVRAQNFTFSLNPAEESGTIGQLVLFQGILSNNTTNTIFISGISNTFNPGVTGEFFQSANVPFSLAPMSSYSGDVFSVRIDSSTNPNAAGGTASVQGGADEAALEELGLEEFIVNFEVVPENNTMALMALALPVAGGIVVARKRRRSCATK